MTAFPYATLCVQGIKAPLGRFITGKTAVSNKLPSSSGWRDHRGFASTIWTLWKGWASESKTRLPRFASVDYQKTYIHRVCKTWAILYCLKVKNVNINQNKNMKGAWTLLKSLTLPILKNHEIMSPPRFLVIQWTRSLLFCHAFPMPLPYALWTTLAHRLWNLRRQTLELPSWSLHVGMMPERQCRPWWLQRHPHRCLNFLFVAVWKAPPLIQQMNQGSYIMFSQPGLFI